MAFLLHARRVAKAARAAEAARRVVAAAAVTSTVAPGAQVASTAAGPTVAAVPSVDDAEAAVDSHAGSGIGSLLYSWLFAPDEPSSAEGQGASEAPQSDASAAAHGPAAADASAHDGASAPTTAPTQASAALVTAAAASGDHDDPSLDVGPAYELHELLQELPDAVDPYRHAEAGVRGGDDGSSEHVAAIAAAAAEAAGVPAAQHTTVAGALLSLLSKCVGCLLGPNSGHAAGAVGGLPSPLVMELLLRMLPDAAPVLSSAALGHAPRSACTPPEHIDDGAAFVPLFEHAQYKAPNPVAAAAAAQSVAATPFAPTALAAAAAGGVGAYLPDQHSLDACAASCIPAVAPAASASSSTLVRSSSDSSSAGSAPVLLASATSMLHARGPTTAGDRLSIRFLGAAAARHLAACSPHDAARVCAVIDTLAAIAGRAMDEACISTARLRTLVQVAAAAACTGLALVARWPLTRALQPGSDAGAGASAGASISPVVRSAATCLWRLCHAPAPIAAACRVAIVATLSSLLCGRLPDGQLSTLLSALASTPLAAAGGSGISHRVASGPSSLDLALVLNQASDVIGRPTLQAGDPSTALHAVLACLVAAVTADPTGSSSSRGSAGDAFDRAGVVGKASEGEDDEDDGCEHGEEAHALEVAASTTAAAAVACIDAAAKTLARTAIATPHARAPLQAVVDAAATALHVGIPRSVTITVDDVSCAAADSLHGVACILAPAAAAAADRGLGLGDSSSSGSDGSCARSVWMDAVTHLAAACTDTGREVVRLRCIDRLSHALVYGAEHASTAGSDACCHCAAAGWWRIGGGC